MGKRLREEHDALATGGEDDLQTANSSSPAKIVELEAYHLPLLHTMQCSLPPHLTLSFASAEEFDLHYIKEHTNRCSSCGKNFPSAHYLALHIEENHDPVREVLAAKGEKTYSCFIEDCDKKCSTPQKRRLHLIDKHMFPKVYNFRIVDQGIDKTTSMLQGGQRRRLSVSNQNDRLRKSSLPSQISSGGRGTGANISEVHKVQEDTALISQNGLEIDDKISAEADIGELEVAFAALKFVPPSVQARQRNRKREP